MLVQCGVQWAILQVKRRLGGSLGIGLIRSFGNVYLYNLCVISFNKLKLTHVLNIGCTLLFHDE